MVEPIQKAPGAAGRTGRGGGILSDDSLTLDFFLTGTDSSIVLFDSELRVIRASAAYARARGVTPDDLSGTCHNDLYAGEELRCFERVCETGKPARIAARPLAAPGTAPAQTTYWDCTLAPVPGGASGIAGLIATETDVTSRVRAEQSLHKVAKILKAIDVAQNDNQHRTDSQQLLDTLLAETMQLTESEYGFIGRVTRPDDGLPRLLVPTILNFTSSDDSPMLSVAEAAIDVELGDHETLLGQVVNSGKPILENEFDHQAIRLGLAIGHPSLHSLLCLPLQGKITEGVIFVANCPDGYDPFLVDALQPLMQGYMQLFESSSLAAERDAALMSLDQSRLLVRDLAVPAVESEHDELINLINQCHEEIEGDADRATVLRILRQLETATAEHFRHEEQLMQSMDYEDFEGHRDNHQALLKALHKHIERYRNDPDHDFDALQDMLNSWFGRHFSTYDLRMNQHFVS